MPIWLERDSRDRTIFIETIGGTWTWQEYKAVEAEFRTMVGSTTERVDLIIDARATVAFPPGIKNYAESALLESAAQGGIIVVVASALVLELLNILANEVPGLGPRLYFTSTVRDARRIILEHRRGSKQPNGPDCSN